MHPLPSPADIGAVADADADERFLRRDSGFNTAGGWVRLDEDGTIPDNRIPASIARDSEVTSAISELAAVYQPIDSDLTAIAALATTSFGRGLLELADAAAARTALGLGSLATASTVTTAEITDGTIAASDLSAAARRRVVTFQVTDPNGDPLETGDGQFLWTVPAELDGWAIVDVQAAVTTASSSGTPTVQVARIRGGTPSDVLSTPVTIDAEELASYTAVAGSVVDAGGVDLATGDQLRVDVDDAGTGAKGLQVIVSMEP